LKVGLALQRGGNIGMRLAALVLTGWGMGVDGFCAFFALHSLTIAHWDLSRLALIKPTERVRDELKARGRRDLLPRLGKGLLASQMVAILGAGALLAAVLALLWPLVIAAPISPGFALLYATVGMISLTPAGGQVARLGRVPPALRRLTRTKIELRFVCVLAAVGLDLWQGAGPMVYGWAWLVAGWLYILVGLIFAAIGLIRAAAAPRAPAKRAGAGAGAGAGLGTETAASVHTGRLLVAELVRSQTKEALARADFVYVKGLASLVLGPFASPAVRFFQRPLTKRMRRARGHLTRRQFARRAQRSFAVMLAGGVAAAVGAHYVLGVPAPQYALLLAVVLRLIAVAFKLWVVTRFLPETEMLNAPRPEPAAGSADTPGAEAVPGAGAAPEAMPGAAPGAAPAPRPAARGLQSLSRSH